MSLLIARRALMCLKSCLPVFSIGKQLEARRIYLVIRVCMLRLLSVRLPAVGGRAFVQRALVQLKY